MKKLILFLTILIPTISYSQINGGIKIYLNSSTNNGETIIAFSDQTTDLVDNFFPCSDSPIFLQDGSLYTTIGTTQYLANSFSELTDDRWIPIGVRCQSQTFEIGINPLDTGIICPLVTLPQNCIIIWDSLTNELYNLPHQFTGPTNGNTRFKIFFEYPLNVKINDLCDSTQIIINDDYSIGQLTLTNNSITTNINSDTIYLQSNGNYTLTLQGDTITEVVTFMVDNINNEEITELIVPLTQVPITDPVIVPILDLNYTPSEIIWDFGDGAIFYNDINPVHQYTQPGVYTLSVVVISQTGCARYLVEFISVYSINGIIPVVNPKKRKSSYKYDLSGRIIGLK
jgi:hypothetical protein